MDIARFLSGRPSLEEVDGYLWGLRWQLENRDKLGLPPQYEEINADVLVPLELYKQELLKKQPKRKRVPPPPMQEDVIDDEKPKGVKVLDRNRPTGKRRPYRMS